MESVLGGGGGIGLFFFLLLGGATGGAPSAVVEIFPDLFPALVICICPLLDDG